MKNIFLILSLTILNFGFAQTQNHVVISGTKCSIIPPSNFEISTKFSGLQNVKNGASIMITEMPTSYQKMSDNFTADVLKAKGMTLISKEIIDYNNSKATFIRISQNAGGMEYIKQLLMFGDDFKTIMVNGIYPEVSKNIESEIKTALLSVSYNEKQNDDASKIMRFSVDTSDSKLKLAKSIPGTLIFTEDGQMPTPKSLFMVTNSLAKVDIENRRQYAIERLKKLPNGDKNKITSVNPITIDNLNGYEIIAEGINTQSKEETVYLVMLFTESSDYFIIAGMDPERSTETLNMFKRIAKSFKRK